MKLLYEQGLKLHPWSILILEEKTTAHNERTGVNWITLMDSKRGI